MSPRVYARARTLVRELGYPPGGAKARAFWHGCRHAARGNPARPIPGAVGGKSVRAFDEGWKVVRHGDRS